MSFYVLVPFFNCFCLFLFIKNFLYSAVYVTNVCGSVPDPDPYVLGPLGSGSVIISTDPDPSINKQTN